MGKMKSWIARKGAVGATARWAGKNYLELKKRNPGITVSEAASTMIAARISAAGYPDAKGHMMRGVASGDIQSLEVLVASILSVEVGQDFDDMYRGDPTSMYSVEAEREDTTLYHRIIQEELQKTGVPDDVI